MKHFIIVVLIWPVLIENLSAQESPVYDKVLFSVEAGAFMTGGNINQDVTGVSLLHDGALMTGVSVGVGLPTTRFLNLGAGVGYRFYESRSRESLAGSRMAQKGLNSLFKEQSLPVFVSAYLSSSTEDLSPFFACKAGYNFLTKESVRDAYMQFQRFFADCSLGLQINMKSVGIRVGFVVMFDSLRNTISDKQRLIPSYGVQIGLASRPSLR
ncbi:MAG: hypothetical protein IKX67_00860 [Bacteroidales bacterium]|nr:hypothetical protein [Bacteroidales bacterium]